MKKTLQLTSLSDHRAGRYMFLLCFTFYFMLYLGRYNYSAALAQITTTGVLEKDAAGLVSTALSISYGFGQLINGFISDRVQPFRLIFIGFLGSGLLNIGMYLAAGANLGLGAFLVIWGLNGYIQSVVWPTMIRIVSNILPEEQQVSAGVSMLATTAIGTVLTYLISSLTMKLSGWMECFLVPGIILMSAAFVWYFATLPISRITVSYTDRVPAGLSTTPITPSENSVRNIKQRPLLPLLLASGAFLMILPIGAMGIIKDGITTWTPTIITETFAAKPEVATLMTTIIPLISIFGAAVSKLIMDKWLKDEMKSSVLMFAVTGAAMALLLFFGSNQLILMQILFAVSIAFLLGINTMFISLVPLKFGKYGKSATMTGILNATAAICSGVSTYLVGVIAKNSGWNLVYIIFLALSALGGIVSFSLIKRWGRFKAE